MSEAYRHAVHVAPKRSLWRRLAAFLRGPWCLPDVGMRRHRHRNHEVAELGLCTMVGSLIPLLPVEYGRARPAVAEEGLARMRALLERTGHR